MENNVNAENSENQSLELEIGKEFSSLVELENSISKYENKTMANFTKFNSRTIEGARKKGLKRHINPILEYAALNYRCVTGLRPQQSSFRSNCPVVLTVRPNDCGDKLVIKSFISEHNHICSKAMCDHYPRKRRLDTDSRIMESKLVTMKVNKKILQNDLMKIHNKIVTLKDIHNLVT
ncbi:protein FAR-RED ELONGATED HYPOCOTYL 3-like [Aphis craccivora]|uniref:Protein FAR-RED ELONGATED HYPOCOTYL 3-like n=1 Tax=Aphis craccivora TaxID=307492 RepID=A0A6G0YKQ3_APHCR|nr:protein FAR-RED ELONGATED HYPOCOTYL 3-like [Aphis craccivora]